MRSVRVTTLAAAGLLAAVAGPAEAAPASGVTVLRAPGAPASFRGELAARELRRYLYLRTGSRPALATAASCEGTGIAAAPAVRLGAFDGVPADVLAAARSLKPGEYAIAVRLRSPAPRVWIAGGDDTGTLYGAYRFAERLGVRFQLQGDVLPDEPIALADLPDGDETGLPLFDVRGIQPFHDFPEGPDWWSADDYLAYAGQLAKLRMNFIGLHCYPEGGVGPEPLVWIGLPGETDASGRVSAAYRTRWAHTDRSNLWGYAAMKTSAFCGGAAGLFPRDGYGHEIYAGIPQEAPTPAQSVEVFHRAGGLLRTVFTEARALGLKTCIGTETPLTVPKAVAERLRSAGRDPADPAVVRELYTGMFRRIAAAHPLDYYWLWTPEGWTWGGNQQEQFEATVRDLRAALSALDGLGRPFTLATCGWVLGPQHDRAALDRVLPPECPMSCINRQVGHAPVEPGFANVLGRPKWAIPWMENDPNLAAPQPWVGRMRADAVAARRLGCTGLLGIHWRTKAMALNLAALAGAAWDQSWVPAGTEVSPIAPGSAAAAEPARTGKAVAFTAPVEGTEDDAVYQTVRYDVDAYRLPVPEGRYSVTLRFNEPHYAEAGKRVFGVRLQGRQVIEHLDMFARAGRNRAIDFDFADVVVLTDGLAIEFTREVEFPCIAGIAVTGRTAAGGPFALRVNCGGPAWRDYAADPLADAADGTAGRDRSMPVDDFYLDFARASFGPGVARDAARILASVDGVRLPEPSGWINGPGGVKPNPEAWDTVRPRYAFVEEFAALRPQVRGAASLERFDYWLNTWRAMAAMAELGCRRAELDRRVAEMKKESDAAGRTAAARRAVELRVLLARLWERLIRLQVAATDTPGELGTIANLEQHSRLHDRFLDRHDADLAAALGAPLPAEIAPAADYAGPDRLIVPTVRSHVRKDAELRVTVMALSTSAVRRVEAFVRPLGGGAETAVSVRPVGRQVHEAAFPAAADDFEYRIRAEFEAGAVLDWPATAPAAGQTVVVLPE